MSSIIVVIALAVVSLIFMYVSFLFLRTRTWFFGFFRGLFGLAFLAIAVFVVATLIDIKSYENLVADTSIATLRVEQTGDQAYSLSFSHILSGEENSFAIKGDQWQIDAKIFRWGAPFDIIGVKPVYRLDRISGRYFSIEQERNSERTVYALPHSKTWLDVWALINDHKVVVPGIDAAYGSATYLPMADGAIYELLLSHKGLVAKPLNDNAKKAVTDWQ